MDYVRAQESPQSKGSVWHREHSDEFADNRPSDVSLKSPTQDETRPFRRVRSPSRPRAWTSSSYKPRTGGGFYRPRDEQSFRKPGVGLQRYHHLSHGPYFHRRDYLQAKMKHTSQRDRETEREREKTKQRDKEREREREKEQDWEQKSEQRSEQRQGTETSSPPKESAATWGPLFPRSISSRDKEKQFTVSQESERNQSRERDHKGGKGKERSRDRELSSTVSQAAARNRAIQQKRREIEEVYHQDCETFSVVARMLIAKDPSLESPIQSSLQQNLREIGLRCVEAMEKFIEEYDSREPSTH
ncbi:putative uncharacterized protein DDB_G0271982 isoform X2 [Myripristis murdjan]|uniref:putative uncharacterized protein DDB_G0271982 isoform X2 n=1 Tax=Myripristis murdjan TaxID=586833 RepID=UPI0011762FC7|nr:putative uncharacterized protein DDB_G0271982 isoform X2 [Myripristis murdjan]